jgi:hypothetical protein
MLIYYRSTAAKCWLCSFAHDARAREYQDLFGTTEIPTPFSLQAAEERVLATLSACNPDATITRGPDAD